MTAAQTNEDDGGRGQMRQAQAPTSGAAAGKPQPPPHHPPNTSRNARATSIDVRADFARLQGGGAYTLGAREQEGQPNQVRVGWLTSGVAAGKPQCPPHHPPSTSRNARAISIDVRANFARLQRGWRSIHPRVPLVPRVLFDTALFTVRYGYYPPQVTVSAGAGTVWQKLTRGIPVLNPSQVSPPKSTPPSPSIPTNPAKAYLTHPPRPIHPNLRTQSQRLPLLRSRRRRR